MRSENELHQIAKDLVLGRIYTSSHLPPDPKHPKRTVKQLKRIFQPLAKMTPAQLDAFADQRPFLLFEYFERAGDLLVSGHPIFRSFQWLTQDETEQVLALAQRFDRAIAIAEGVLGFAEQFKDALVDALTVVAQQRPKKRGRKKKKQDETVIRLPDHPEDVTE